MCLFIVESIALGPYLLPKRCLLPKLCLKRKEARGLAFRRKEACGLAFRRKEARGKGVQKERDVLQTFLFRWSLLLNFKF